MRGDASGGRRSGGWTKALETVVEAGAGDGRAQLVRDRPSRRGSACSDLSYALIGKADIEVFGLDRPVPRQRIFDAEAGRPARKGAGPRPNQRGGRSRSASRDGVIMKRDGLRKVDIADCKTG
jgi:hypothetical protein